MNAKEELLQAIAEALAADFELVFGAARAAHEAAIHEENIPDNEYDTLSLEASYVAQGQANRAQEIKAALDAYRGLHLQEFGDGSRVRLTALVTLEDEEGKERVLFLGPAAGGMKVPTAAGEVTVITPQSPLGRELLGKGCGDIVAIGDAGEKEYEIVAIG